MIGQQIGNASGQFPRLVRTALVMALALGSHSGFTQVASKPPAAKCTSSVKVGALMTLSGSQAALGNLMLRGAQRAVNDVNQAGGVNGTCVTLVTADDGGDPTKGSQAARRLISQERVKAMVGPLFTGVVAAVLPIANVDRIPLIHTGGLPAGGDPKIFPFAFRANVTTIDYAKLLLEAAKRVGATRAGLLMSNDQWGHDLTTFIKENAGAYGIEVVDTQVMGLAEPDLTPYVAKLQQFGNINVLLSGLHSAAGINGVVARNAVKWDIPYVGVVTIMSNALLPKVTASSGQAGLKNVYATGVPIRLQRAPGSALPSGQEAATLYKSVLASEDGDKIADQFFAVSWGYDYTSIMLQAMVKAKSLDGTAIRDALESAEYPGPWAVFKATKTDHNGWPPENFAPVLIGTLQGGLAEAMPGTRLPKP